MKNLLIRLGINLGLFALEKYVKNTDSEKDDKVLKILKLGTSYLAPKTNNDVSLSASNSIQNWKMIQCQKSKD